MPRARPRGMHGRFMNWVGGRNIDRDDRVPALVIGGQHFLLFGHDHRAPLRIHHDLIFRLPRERPTTISTDIPLVTKN
jgi:hypothetical protein